MPEVSADRAYGSRVVQHLGVRGSGMWPGAMSARIGPGFRIQGVRSLGCMACLRASELLCFRCRSIQP